MYSTGWLPDKPDSRDYDAADAVPRMRWTGNNYGPVETAIRVDNRRYCSPIENQGSIGSCTAQAVAGLVEMYERVNRRRHTDASRLFLYWVARRLDGFVGDTGAHVRTAMKALRLFGVPPERFWPYETKDFDLEPSAFAFTYAQSRQAITYWRLDVGRRTRDDILDLLKSVIMVKQGVVFGFRVYNYGNERGEFAMPTEGSVHVGGHAVMAVGYDDTYRIGDSVGAIRIRNSWGKNWGDNGYGWLPYDYVRRHYAWDFWTLTQQELAP